MFSLGFYNFCFGQLRTSVRAIIPSRMGLMLAGGKHLSTTVADSGGGVDVFFKTFFISPNVLKLLL